MTCHGPWSSRHVVIPPSAVCRPSSRHESSSCRASPARRAPRSAPRASELDRLLVAQREDPERLEAVVEELVHAVLERLAEVDHDVAAHDDVELVEGRVRDQVVLGEHHRLRSSGVKRASSPSTV